MAKSKIIKELANDAITLEVALTRSVVIANDICNDEFREWIEKELSGYLETDTIPDYRIVKDTFFKYTGKKGMYLITDSPIPLKEILIEKPAEYWYVNIYDGISGIQKFTNDTSGVEAMRDLTYLAGQVYHENGTQCTAIRQIIPVNAFENVLSKVKSKLLQTLIYLDKEYGSLDELDVDISCKTDEEVKVINNTIINYIYKDISIKTGNHNSFNKCDSVKIEDGTINIGNDNTIESSVIGSNNERKIINNIGKKPNTEKWYSKFTWNVVVPIIVGVTIVAICVWLGLQE